LPHLGSLEDVAVGSSEHLWFDGAIGDLRDLVAAWPDFLEKNVFTFAVFADGLLLKVNINGTSEAVSDNEGRGSQVVSTGVGVDTAFEVSVSRKYGGSNHIVLDDGILNGVWDFS